MKIIDEKGRFFGKVNLLDLVVLVFVVVVVGVIAMKLVQNPESYSVSTGDNIQKMYVTVKCQNVPTGFVERMEVGDKLIAQNAYTGGEIYKIHEAGPAIYNGYDSDGNVVLSEHPENLDVLVTLVTDQNVESPILKINGQEARIGTRIFFKTQKVEVSSMVEDIVFDESEVK
ncbi:MAG: DUF4330 domain-containing protein [Lachnospirales bacterium]